MSVTKQTSGWFGTEAPDLDEYLRHFAAGGYPVARVSHASCQACGRTDSFSVAIDDVEGVAVRTCSHGGNSWPMLDSAEFLDDADIAEAACPCGHERFEVAVGYSLLEDGEVRWVSVGLRCQSCGLLGVYTD